jgi:dTDP-4-dehydrorhamnose 3,5-epimerase
MIQKFNFEKTEIEGLYLIDPFVAWDNRGYFTKDYSKEVFMQNGITHDLQEVFYTNSYQGVVRAMHFQRIKQQPKLVRCVFGHVYDVVADLRKDSSMFGKWIGFDLSEENKKEILIPAGCAHGYLVLEHSIVSYKCAEKFFGEYDDGIIWDDKELGIQWPLAEIGGRDKVILADKDKNLQTFDQFKNNYGGF